MLTKWLIRRFVRDADRVQEETVRYAYGRLAGGAGLAANVLLFAAKLLAGALAGSVAVMADAFNNLSDAGSSVVTLIGFKLSSAPPDKEHPFGHGRMEYLSALGVAALIMIAGVQFFLSAVDKIRHPALPDFGALTVVILIAAILVKLWMALFFRRIGTLIGSQTLRAAGADSRNDVICTAVVLVSSVVGWCTGVAIDGYVGVAVSLFVVWSGFSVVWETISPLLGQAPDPAMVKSIRETVLSYPGVIGIHDLMIHNYGPGRLVISLHAEVPCQADMMRSHDLIDCVERDLSRQYHAVVCIHMDPVDSGNEEVERLRRMTQDVLHQIDERLTLHDFRVVFGQTHTNMIFDVVVPFGFQEEAGLKDEIQRRVTERDNRLFTVVTTEHSFT